MIVGQDETTLDQELYVEKALQTFGFEDIAGAITPMMSEWQPGPRQDHEPKTTNAYLQAVGTLLYLSTSTRPDISYTVGVLARFNADPGEKHWEGVIRLFRYLKHTKNYRLVIRDQDSALPV